jgi:Ran GTPase-activating protein (RanGAP) involved in mRNA processing and transport
MENKEIELILNLIKENKATKLNMNLIKLTENDHKLLIGYLKDNTSVEAIFLNFDMKAEYISQFIEVLKSNTTCKVLYLENKKSLDHKDYNKDIQLVSDVLRNNQGIKILNLKGYGLDIDGSQLLVNSIKQNNFTRITTLTISNNRIGSKGVEYINELLYYNNTISILDLSNNELYDEGVKTFSSCLISNETLKEVNLSYNGFCEIEELCNNLKENKTLKVLNLSWNYIDDKGIIALNDCLAVNNTISEIYLGKNRITNLNLLAPCIAKEDCGLGVLDLSENKLTAVDEFLRSLGNNKSLISINISNTGLDKCDIKLLSESLITNKTLKELNLSTLNIDKDSIDSIILILKCSNLEKLELYDNKIDDDSSVLLFNALKSNKYLKDIDLENNFIGVNGSRGLAELLKENERLQDINLKDNLLKDEGVKNLVEVLKECEVLTYLNVVNNSLTDEGAKALLSVSEANPLIRIDIL